MRKVMTATAMAMAMAGGSMASAEEARGAFTVTVHVTDNAHVSPRELANAQAQATAAYRAAGFTLVWSTDAVSADAGGNGAASPSINVRVVLVDRTMGEKKCHEEGLADSVMAVALTKTAEAGGPRLVYIFVDRIERVAVSHHRPVVRGLGHVMAHEVGHLLIGVHSHSDEGLMRPNWNPRENRLQTFTPSQVQTIRRRFTATSAD